jgi:hypothetical protein
MADEWPPSQAIFMRGLLFGPPRLQTGRETATHEEKKKPAKSATAPNLASYVT